MNEETGLKDKTGRMIHIGDIVQLIAAGKTGGAEQYSVQLKNNKLVIGKYDGTGGFDISLKLDEERAEKIVVVDSKYVR